MGRRLRSIDRVPGREGHLTGDFARDSRTGRALSITACQYVEVTAVTSVTVIDGWRVWLGRVSGIRRVEELPIIGWLSTELPLRH